MSQEGTGPHSPGPRKQEALFHLVSVSLETGSGGGGSTSLQAQCAVLLPPAYRWSQAGKAPAPRPSAPLFSKQTDRKMKPQKAPCFCKTRGQMQMLLHLKYYKILTWPLVK